MDVKKDDTLSKMEFKVNDDDDLVEILRITSQRELVINLPNLRKYLDNLEEEK